jgi:hypothetical protein
MPSTTSKIYAGVGRNLAEPSAHKFPINMGSMAVLLNTLFGTQRFFRRPPACRRPNTRETCASWRSRRGGGSMSWREAWLILPNLVERLAELLLSFHTRVVPVGPKVAVIRKKCNLANLSNKPPAGRKTPSHPAQVARERLRGIR